MENRQYKDFWEFIKLLSDNRLLNHVLVVGSWAEYLYAQSGILPGYTANLRTLDIDFLVKNMRKPTPQANVVSLAKEAGYTVDYDTLDSVTKLYTPGLMEVEFLICQQGSGEVGALDTNLGVCAQALRHMTILRQHTLQVTLYGMKISVPQPEAYVLHKIIINRDRGKKAEKDAAAIETLLPFLPQEQAATLYQSLTKNEKKAVLTFFQSHPALREQQPFIP